MPREKTRGFRTMAATTTTTMFFGVINSDDFCHTAGLSNPGASFFVVRKVRGPGHIIRQGGGNGRAAKTRPMFVRRLHAWIYPLPPPATAHVKIVASHLQLGRGGRSVLTPAMKRPMNSCRACNKVQSGRLLRCTPHSRK